MPQQITTLTVFVSGTSESEAEKAALKRVLEELSGVLEKTHAISLRSAAFPHSIRPGVNTDPQAEINRQIGNYDVFVGILGCRFGTPTPRAGSGTEEEFNIALDRFSRDTQSLRVLFYFNRAAVDPFCIDVPQLEKVLAFRERLSDRGVLFRDFRGTPDFIDVLRDNLHHLVIDDWQAPSWRLLPMVAGDRVQGDRRQPETTAANPDAGRTEQNGDGQPDFELSSEAPGYLELVEAFEAQNASLLPTIERIAAHTQKIGNQFQLRTKEIQALIQSQSTVKQIGGSRAKQQYIAEAKTLVDKGADDLDSYTDEMDRDVALFRSDARELITLTRQLMIAQHDMNNSEQQRTDDCAAIARFVMVLRENRDHTTTFQIAISQMPPMTSHFRKARKNAAIILGEFLAELQFLIVAGEELLGEMCPDLLKKNDAQ